MPSSGWSNREMLIGGAIAFVCGVFVTAAWFKPRDQPESAHQKRGGSPLPPEPHPPTPDPPEPQPTTPELQAPPEMPSADVRPPSLEELARKVAESKKELAHLNCRRLSRAIEEYAKSSKNLGTTDAEKLPLSPTDLAKPPFGGPPFIESTFESLRDPWIKVYEFDLHSRKDGTIFILIHTTAPDGTPISQFGIGEKNALPNR